MTDLLKTTDTWFLVFFAMLAGGGFLWAVKRMIDDLTATIRELKDTIRELFEHKNEHSERIRAIEIRCDERQIKGGGCR